MGDSPVQLNTLGDVQTLHMGWAKAAFQSAIKVHLGAMALQLCDPALAAPFFRA